MEVKEDEKEEVEEVVKVVKIISRRNSGIRGTGGRRS